MSTRKSLAWSFSQQFGRYGIQFVGSVAIARLLTPHEVGVFALAMAASFLISSFKEFGVGSYLVREHTLNDDKIRTAFGMWIVISWTLGLIVLVVRHYIAALYDNPGIADILTLVSLNFFITPLGQPAHALLVRDMRFDLLHHITLASVVVTITVNIALAVAGFSYMALAWGLVAGTAVNSTLLIVARPGHLWMLPSFRYWRDVLSFGGWLTGTSIVGTINSEGIKFILGGVINPAALALFERSQQLPIAIRMAITQPLGKVLFPAYAKMIREKKRINESFIKVAGVTNVLIWPPLLVLGFLAIPVVVLIFGEQWRVAGEIMPFIIGARVAQTLIPNPQEILMASGEVRKLFGMTALLTIIGLLASPVAALYGLTVFAVVILLRAILASVVHYYVLAPIVGFSRMALVRAHLRSLAVAVITSAPAAAASFTYGDDLPIEVLLALVPLCGLAWLLAVVLIRHEILRELRTVVSSLKRSLGAATNQNE